MEYKFVYNEKRIKNAEGIRIREIETLVAKKFTITTKDMFMAENYKILILGYYRDNDNVRIINVIRVTELINR